tara:strand:+ start:301 stop:510 length:210 start_codon:yes stop_codon:yes gene_type:complete
MERYKMNEINKNQEREECNNEECEEKRDGEGFDCGDHGAGFCEYCYDDYLHGEWEPDFEQVHPSAGRGF